MKTKTSVTGFLAIVALFSAVNAHALIKGNGDDHGSAKWLGHDDAPRSVSTKPADLTNIVTTGKTHLRHNENGYESVLENNHHFVGSVPPGLEKGFRFRNPRLRGTVAPEPVSMALMAAGMVGIPFARRLRKSMKG